MQGDPSSQAPRDDVEVQAPRDDVEVQAPRYASSGRVYMTWK